MKLIPKIREKRMETHMTQSELAAKLNIKAPHLSSLENGRYFPSLELVFQIAKECNCKVDDLYKYID